MVGSTEHIFEFVKPLRDKDHEPWSKEGRQGCHPRGSKKATPSECQSHLRGR
jgi:hypothetical protein